MTEAFSPVAVCPLPKSHAYEVIVPSGSEEPDPLNDTAYGALPAVPVEPMAAVGAMLSGSATVTVTDSVLVSPSLSVTVRLAV